MLKRQHNKGFTIIEVLIVLAIAGLIMLIVFLAVPSLQRNSRNTQRKSDVSGVLGAVNEWSNNNSGKLPANATEQAAALGNANLGIYSGAVTWGAGAATNNTTIDAAVIRTSAKCSAGNAIAGSSRQVAVLYTVETGGTPQHLCQDS